MHSLLILLVGVVGTYAAQSFDLRKIPDRVSPKALEALTRFRAAYAEFLRTHPNATLAKRTKPERIFNPPDIEREIGFTPMQTIRYRGFPGEEHTHQTTDGYINTLFRIPYGRGGPDYNPIGTPRPVAYLQHGLLDTGFTWINNLPHQSLGFLLAEAGFDVWIGNVRGSTFSRAHVELDPDWDNEFWYYSWDQMAKYDLPAAFDYIRSRTGQQKLFYTGHSMGTTMGFAGFSRYPDLAARVKVFAALAPVAKVGNIRGPLAYIAPFTDMITGILDLFGFGELIADGPLLQFLKAIFCNQITSVFGCESILWLFCGWDDRNINTTRVPVFMAKTPGGTSVQNVLHFGQNVNKNTFRMFDYGYDGNLEVYGQSKPPDYEVSQFPVKTLLFWSESDWLAGRRDVEWLIKNLPPSKLLLERHLPNYQHLDFVWAHNANDLIYRDIIRIFKENL